MKEHLNTEKGISNTEENFGRPQITTRQGLKTKKS